MCYSVNTVCCHGIYGFDLTLSKKTSTQTKKTMKELMEKKIFNLSLTVEKN